MKRFSAALCALLLLFSLSVSPAAAEEAKLQVIATVFPVWDWTREVIGDTDGIELSFLLDNGVDMHSYQPSVQDIVRISQADAVICVGGESERWLEDAFAGAVNPDQQALKLLDALGDSAREEETVEGMEAEEEENEEGPALDEHIWLSLKNAQKLVPVIASVLSRIDPANADSYSANAQAYCLKLAELDARYAQAVEEAEHKTVLFGDRFPFRYLTEDYGLTYYAAFAGCSAESEASFNTIIFLAGKVDELGLSAVLTVEGAGHRLAETVVSGTREKSQRILTLDSLQSTTAADAAAGKTYLTAMESNLEILREALR